MCMPGLRSDIEGPRSIGFSHSVPFIRWLVTIGSLWCLSIIKECHFPSLVCGFFTLFSGSMLVSSCQLKLEAYEKKELEEFPPPDWPVGMTVWYFHSFIVAVGRLRPLWMLPSLGTWPQAVYKNKLSTHGRQASRHSSPMASALYTALPPDSSREFLPWPLLVMDCDL